MRKANRKNGASTINQRLAEVRMNEHDRRRAAHAIQDAEAIVDGVIWVSDRISSLGAILFKPVFKH